MRDRREMDRERRGMQIAAMSNIERKGGVWIVLSGSLRSIWIIYSAEPHYMPKHASLKPPGRCIFCGVTQEHMWANWLRSYIPRELTRHATSVEKVHPRNTEQNIQTRTGDPHSRRIKCVCRACNNGWMSRLQENAKPFLGAHA